MVNNYKEFLKTINEAKNIAIFTHTIPDGDAIGSSFGLACALKNMGKNVCVVLPETVPDDYRYFDLDDLLKYEIPENIDLIISTDSASLERLGIFSINFKNFSNTIAIDHHISFEPFAKLNLINAKSSSASEFVYDILKACGIKFDKNIAEFLYLGILRDTGGFMHNCTTSHTFNVSAELLKFGVDAENINRHFMLTTTLKNTMLLKTALENLNLYNYGKIAISTISNEDLAKNEAKVEHTATIVNNILAINTVEVAILITEVQANSYKVSIRTKKVDANDIAGDFGGGGHSKASGCQMYGEKSKVINALKRASEERLKK